MFPEENYVRTHLLKCYQINIKYDSEDKYLSHEADTNIRLGLQPVKAKIGFKEINEFKIAFDRIQYILESLTSQNKQIVDKLQKEYYEILEQVIYFFHYYLEKFRRKSNKSAK